MGHVIDLASCTPITMAAMISPNVSVCHIHITQPRKAAMMVPETVIITAIATPPQTTNIGMVLYCVSHSPIPIPKSAGNPTEPNPAATAASADTTAVITTSIGERGARTRRKAGIA
jgi:hypothetical protein